MSESEKISVEKPIQKTSARTRGVWEGFYLFVDTARRSAIERFDDLHTFLVFVGGFVVSLFASLISFILVWSSGGVSRKFAPFRLIKSLVGLVVVGTIAFFGTIVLFVGGSVASILGFRNIADYSSKEQIAAWLAFLLFVLAAPFVAPEYLLFKISLAFAYAIGVIGLDFLYGQCGILSMGHAGFLFLGGYVLTWLTNGFFGPEFPVWLAIPISAFSMIGLGLIIGAPSLRIKDYYLVILTLALALAVPRLMKSPYMAKWSGLREGGLSLRSLKFPEFMSWLPPEKATYFIVALPSLLLIYIAYNLVHHSQIGRAFKTIRCDTEVSMIMGIPVVKYKLMAFMLSAVYAGFCGAFLTVLTRFIHPESYTVQDSINFLVANVVGGPGSLLGASLGGIFLSFEPDFTHTLAELFPRGKDLARGFYGVILILTIYAMPNGVAGQLTSWLSARLTSTNRRGAYRVSPPPDYEYLEEIEHRKAKRPSHE